MANLRTGWVVPITFLGSFLGGIFFQWVLAPRPLEAAGSRILQADQLWLYGPDGKHRLQFGTYTASSEQGLPLIGFSDNGGNLRLLLRLAGQNESPVLIFKDKSHRDRIVIGLGMNEADEAPFFSYIDKDGATHNLLR